MERIIELFKELTPEEQIEVLMWIFNHKNQA